MTISTQVILLHLDRIDKFILVWSVNYYFSTAPSAGTKTIFLKLYWKLEISKITLDLERKQIFRSSKFFHG